LDWQGPGGFQQQLRGLPQRNSSSAFSSRVNRLCTSDPVFPLTCNHGPLLSSAPATPAGQQQCASKAAPRQERILLHKLSQVLAGPHLAPHGKRRGSGLGFRGEGRKERRIGGRAEGRPEREGREELGVNRLAWQTPAGSAATQQQHLQPEAAAGCSAALCSLPSVGSAQRSNRSLLSRWAAPSSWGRYLGGKAAQFGPIRGGYGQHPDRRKQGGPALEHRGRFRARSSSKAAGSSAPGAQRQAKPMPG